MPYTFQQLLSDVLARLGEFARPADSSLQLSIPTIADVLSLKIGSLLPHEGRRLIADAPLSALVGGEGWSGEMTATMMPCGLYAQDIDLPEDFVRVVSVKMESWHRNAMRVIATEEPEWLRQWSAESGIAGCKERPMLYLMQEGGLRLRCIGSDDEDDELASLGIWRTPRLDEDGSFNFPQALYEDLVAEIALKLLD